MSTAALRYVSVFPLNVLVKPPAPRQSSVNLRDKTCFHFSESGWKRNPGSSERSQASSRNTSSSRSSRSSSSRRLSFSGRCRVDFPLLRSSPPPAMQMRLSGRENAGRINCPNSSLIPNPTPNPPSSAPPYTSLTHRGHRK
ncbi:unnamed protein product [Pleuronectes platessa]|uniref:Uncharacterized protein n=1 Tax=Pleuronectes platessa TaxID=8262 RepID=A0A9N7VNK5_PLEPL|nr:unnamed protein product [Pleuronectes platessa]